MFPARFGFCSLLSLGFQGAVGSQMTPASQEGRHSPLAWMGFGAGESSAGSQTDWLPGPHGLQTAGPRARHARHLAPVHPCL